MGRENRTGIYELGQEPELPDLFRVALRNLRLSMRTHTIARVVSYNPATQRATVTVDILQVVKDTIGEPTPADPNPTSVQDPVTLVDLPVAWPRTSSGYLTFPLSPGDVGELHVQDRSLEAWLSLGQATDPVAAWTHNLADSVFHPAIFNDADPITPPTDTQAAVLEGQLIKLGRLAALGVARLNDTVGVSPGMATWFSQVAAAINAIAPGAVAPPFPPDFGSITSASTKVSSE